MPNKGKYDAVDAAYEFLISRSKSGTTFSLDELLQETQHWQPSTATTYFQKYLKDFVKKVGADCWSVRPEFAGFSKNDFRNLQKQTKKVYQDYSRRAYGHVTCFEFLLPLTRQDRLREALDRLFYKDTIIERVEEIGLSRMQKIVPRLALDMDDQSYRDYVATEISNRFGGYSIGHVAGRFRAAALMPREEAWKHRYLVDEATAVVRFIIPAKTGAVSFSDAREIDGLVDDLVAAASNDLELEARRTRLLFFEFFVEAIVRTIDKEDEIWLLESGTRNHLYVWAKQ